MHKLLLLFLTIIVFPACAHAPEKAYVAPEAAGVKRVYLWDADGHSDITLLRGLKAAAAKRFREMGVAVSDDPAATDAFVKITVEDAKRDPDAGRSSVKARLYVLSATDNAAIYDNIAGAAAKGGGYDGPEYPVEEAVKRLLSGFPAAGAK